MIQGWDLKKNFMLNRGFQQEASAEQKDWRYEYVSLCVSATVNTQGFVWKFFKPYINFYSFIHENECGTLEEKTLISAWEVSHTGEKKAWIPRKPGQGIVNTPLPGNVKTYETRKTRRTEGVGGW